MSTPRRVTRISNSLRKLIHPDLFQAASPSVKSTNLKALTTLNGLIGSLNLRNAPAKPVLIRDKAGGKPTRLDFYVRSSSSELLSKSVSVNPSKFSDEAGMFSELKRIHDIATGVLSESTTTTSGREDQDKVYGTSLRSSGAARRRRKKAPRRMSKDEMAELAASLDGEYLKMKEGYSLGLHVGKFGGGKEADIIAGSVERIVGSAVKRVEGGSVVGGGIVKEEVGEKIRSFLVAMLGLSLREYNHLTSGEHDTTMYDLLKRDGLKYALFDSMQFELLQDGWDLVELEVRKEGREREEFDKVGAYAATFESLS
ncbi:hypothetical protein TL16_g10908 [Triparma laevis f. inornata]|uniref:Uncharacterized protein n=2 Tax=Triparma laevis TaxID=1534972 RepID=A0A9W7CHP4_9STRA|nr:hypothetical protein TL16_g10908 [Triparma laevis f. inornata]GMI05910.1 hypothetical protein TrLO_g5616 [Triparma laevis f. longispina]